MMRRGMVLIPGLILFVYCYLFVQQFKQTQVPLVPLFFQKVEEQALLKPRIFFRTYANSIFSKAKERIIKEANGTGWFTSVEGLGPEDLPPMFTEVYKDILSLDRGGGYWIWKMAVIEMAMDSMDEGDVLVYVDAGCKINKEGAMLFQEYLQVLQESPYDMIGFQIGHTEQKWTTEAIFQAFNVSKDDPIRTTHQIMATSLFLRKGNHLRQWLARVNQVLMHDPFLITDKYNGQGKSAYPGFKDNRHDQSIFSVSRKQMGCILLPSKQYPPGNATSPIWSTRSKG